MTTDGVTKPTLVDCPEPETLRGFVLGKISPEAIEAVGGHLAHCSRCETALSDLDDLCDSFVEYLRDYDESLCREAGYQELVRQMAEYTAPLDSETQPSRSDAAAPSTRRLDAAIPGQLGNYQLIEKLGQGAMGAVYQAWHTKLKRTVAVKVLSPKRLDDPHVIERFAREMEALGKLDDHPHVIRARDAGESDGHHYLVMDYVDGIDLGLLLLRSGPLSVADGCEVARQAALGLSHAHRHGLLHRDVKPSNLMLTRSGSVQVLDLGLASFRGDETTESAIVGTADYMAPEQWADGAQLDVGVDVYGLGCMLYKLLVGHAPFAKSAISSRAKRRAHQKTRPPAVGAARSDVPPELDALIASMLAKRPSRRPAQAGVIAEALAPFAEGADLKTLATSVLGPRDDTQRQVGDATLGQRILGPLTLVQTSRRRWLAVVLGVGGLAAGGWWGAERFLWSAPFEVLIAGEPAFVRWEYDPAVDGLQSHATGEVLYRLQAETQESFELSSEIRRLDENVEAGLFFAYFETTEKDYVSRQFEVIGLRADDQRGRIGVFRRQYTIYINGPRTAWTPKEIASVSVSSRTTDHLNRLQVALQDGQLIKVTLDGQEIKELVESNLRSPVPPQEPTFFGVFNTEGTSYFAHTRLEPR
jgi:tRNA A-37 threonylcarbamoyl transferase component Bud32